MRREGFGFRHDNRFYWLPWLRVRDQWFFFESKVLPTFGGRVFLGVEGELPTWFSSLFSTSCCSSLCSVCHQFFCFLFFFFWCSSADLKWCRGKTQSVDLCCMHGQAGWREVHDCAAHGAGRQLNCNLALNEI